MSNWEVVEVGAGVVEYGEVALEFVGEVSLGEVLSAYDRKSYRFEP